MKDSSTGSRRVTVKGEGEELQAKGLLRENTCRRQRQKSKLQSRKSRLLGTSGHERLDQQQQLTQLLPSRDLPSYQPSYPSPPVFQRGPTCPAQYKRAKPEVRTHKFSSDRSGDSTLKLQLAINISFKTSPV